MYNSITTAAAVNMSGKKVNGPKPTPCLKPIISVTSGFEDRAYRRCATLLTKIRIKKVSHQKHHQKLVLTIHFYKI